MRVGAMNADTRTWIYIELAVNHDRVASVNGDVRGQVGVVIDLEPLTGGRPYLETLVIPRLNRVGEDRGIECDFGSAAAADDVLMKGLVIGGFATAASAEGDRNRERRQRNNNARVAHKARACSSESLPS